MGDFCRGKVRFKKTCARTYFAGLEYAGRPGGRHVSVFAQKLERTSGNFSHGRGDSQDIVSGFQNGGDDYVVKPFELEVLHSRILALLRRAGNGAKQYLSCDGIEMDLNRRSVSCHSKEVDVSPAEYELLLYLMENKGKTLTRERILEQIWDVKGNYVNNNTLTVTMKRLRDKLCQPACIKTVRSVGYRMEDRI